MPDSENKRSEAITQESYKAISQSNLYFDHQKRSAQLPNTNQNIGNFTTSQAKEDKQSHSSPRVFENPNTLMAAQNEEILARTM